MRRRLASAALLAALPILPAGAQPAAEPGLRAPRGALEVVLPGGRVAGGAALVGATLDLGPAFGTVRIAGVTPDPLDQQGEVMLYDLRRRDPATGAWDRPACEPTADGLRAALMLETPSGIAPHCAGVNAAKCVRMGYAPWRLAADGRALADHYRACLRMLPAEYAGDGRFHTRNGMRIEIFDFAGINDPENSGGMPFEAGWTPDGAVCVAHARVPEITDTADLAAAAPRLAAAGRLGAEACTPEAARGWGALVFNRSVAE
jgi:hypothetical protein